MALTLNGAPELLPRSISGPIFEKAAESSIVMQLANRAPTTLRGTAIPVTVGDIEADWVAEGGEKHVADIGAGVKLMEPKKVAAIILASEEFYRTDPGGLYGIVKEKAGEAIARAFDVASLFGKRTVGAGAGPFSTFIGQTTQAVELGTATAAEGGVYGDLVAAQALVDDFNGYALDKTMKARLANTRDTLGRVLEVGTGTIGGERAVYGKAVHRGGAAVAGFGGDWTQCAYGVGMEITVKVTDQASVKVGADMVSLWQTNQVGLLVEAAYGFVVNDPAANFVQFDEATP